MAIDAENQTLRCRQLEKKVVGITATMLTKCLRELEADQLIERKQYNTIPRPLNVPSHSGESH